MTKCICANVFLASNVVLGTMEVVENENVIKSHRYDENLNQLQAVYQLLQGIYFTTYITRSSGDKLAQLKYIRR